MGRRLTLFENMQKTECQSKTFVQLCSLAQTQFLLSSLLVQKVIYSILGVRLLEDIEVVRNLFTNYGSLWMAWLDNHVFHRNFVWLAEDSPR